MSAILGAVPGSSKLQGCKSDDWVDKMSHVGTVYMIVIFAIVVSEAQFVGDPIHCWVPAEYDVEDWYETYTDWYCWIANTYYLPFWEEVPVQIDERQDKELAYYQWVPLILVLQAFLFKLPNIIWQLTHSFGGINLDKIVTLAETTQELVTPDERRQIIKHLAIHIDKWINNARPYKRNRYTRGRARAVGLCGLICSKRGGTYLTGLCFWIKLLYVINAIGQFFLLNAFMATNYHMYGLEVIHGLHNNSISAESPRFPRVTLCDFEIRQLQNVLRFTVQCVLPINLFNEKIFLFLWFWFAIIAVVSIFSLMKWSIFIMWRRKRSQFVRKYLKINYTRVGFDKREAEKFVKYYLRDDGVFVLTMITRNSTDIVTTDLVRELWEMFRGVQKTSHKQNGDLP